MVLLSDLQNTSNKWNTLQERVTDTHELLTLAIEQGDLTLTEILQSEIADISSQLREQEFQLTLSGEYDKRNSILAIHAGAGGTESQDWAQILLRMYLRWAERRGYNATVMDISPGDEAGIKSVLVNIVGNLAYGYIKSDAGVHRLVRLSPFDSAHMRHTSFALVEVLPEADQQSDVIINADDLRIDVFRASGHGGQSVQKNSTAVRITHIPSGIVVTCQNERSQFQNKEYAMKVLRARLMELESKRRAEQRNKLKGAHISAEWGNQIRSYILHPYRMVKDHRTGYETSDTNAILDGDLDQIIQAYLIDNVGR